MIVARSAVAAQDRSAVQMARDLLGRHPLVDGHNDLPWAMRSRTGYDLATYDIGQRQSATHTDLVRLREGGVGVQFWSVYVPSTLERDAAVTATLEQVDFVHRMVAAYPDRLEFATTADEARSAFTAGRIASLLGAEGGQSIAGSLGVLRQLHRLGVRYLTLTHNNNVPWADSATDERRLGGLSEFGRDVVREMNSLGMLVDLSHVSTETMHDALDTSAAPVLFSHSSCRALVNHPRNVPDGVLTRLASNGGVCMVTFVARFVSHKVHAWEAEYQAAMTSGGHDRRDESAWRNATEAFARTNPRPVATISDVADHIDHVREVAGLHHVGVGGDFDGCADLPNGLQDVSGYPRLFAELLDRGWSEDELAKLAGRNALRVLGDAHNAPGGTSITRGDVVTSGTIPSLTGGPDEGCGCEALPEDLAPRGT